MTPSDSRTEAEVELVNLYHLARTALDRPDVHDRMVWAANAYGREHSVPAIRAYKSLDRALHGYTRWEWDGHAS